MRYNLHKALFASLLVKITHSSIEKNTEKYSEKYDEIEILDDFDYGKDTVLKLAIDYEIDSSGDITQDAKWASSELKKVYRRGNFLKVNFIFNRIDGKTFQSEDPRIDDGMVDVEFDGKECKVSNFGKREEMNDKFTDVSLEHYLTILANHYDLVVDAEVTETATDETMTTAYPSNAEDDEASNCCRCKTDCSCCKDSFWSNEKKDKCLATECNENQDYEDYEISE